MCRLRLYNSQDWHLHSSISQGSLDPRHCERPLWISADRQNVSLPALIFSSIVTAFTPDNISAFGSLAMVAILYQVLGLSLALVVREIFYVPMDFQWGILVVSIRSDIAHCRWDVRRIGGICPSPSCKRWVSSRLSGDRWTWIWASLMTRGSHLRPRLTEGHLS